MPLPAVPLLPIVAGVVGAGTGAALTHWLTVEPDAWADKDVFNARMRDMHSLALALNAGFAKCPAFAKLPFNVAAWRGVRDDFGKFYADVGKQVYFAPNDSVVAQAKSYASKFAYWVTEYERLKCGPRVAGSSAGSSTDPYAPKPASQPTQTDWATVAKWSAVGLLGAYGLKTLNDLFAKR